MNRRTLKKGLRPSFFAVAVLTLLLVALGHLYAQQSPEGEKPNSVDNGLPAFPLFGSDALEKGDFDKR